MTMAVRRARADDVDWLIAELRDFAAFVDAPVSLIEDEPYAREKLLEMVEKHYVIIATKECEVTGHGLPVGLLGAYYIPHPFNPRVRHLCEQFWWVSPSARGSRAGALLLKEYMAFGKANADLITIALEDKSPINQKSLEKRGFRLAERSFVWVGHAS